MFLDMNVNWLAVLAAALVNMALGFLWYGPIFGKAWMKLSGLTDAKLNEMKNKGMSSTYVLSMLGALVMAFVMAQFVNISGASTVTEGALLGFWAWLGLVAPVQLTQVLYEGKSWNLYFINTGYYLVSLKLMGAVLASWG